MANVTWCAFDGPEAVSQAATDRLLAAMHRALDARGRADLVLTGGSLGIAMLANLTSERFAARLPQDLAGVHLWWGDERFVGRSDEDRNSGQALDAMAGALSGATLHLVPGPEEAASPEDAAASYARELTGVEFDIVFLGMGPDGHIASLFPGHEQVLEDSADALAELDSPKPPPERVTMSGSRLRAAAEIVLLFAGEEKHAAAAALLADASLDGEQTRVNVPAPSSAGALEVPARLALTDRTTVLSDVSARQLIEAGGAKER